MLCFVCGEFYAFYCYAELHYSECRYAECRFAECHGATPLIKMPVICALMIIPNFLFVFAEGSKTNNMIVTIKAVSSNSFQLKLGSGVKC